jgi:hypothetical protein
VTADPNRRVYLSPEGWEDKVSPIMKFRLTYRGVVRPSQPHGNGELSDKQQSLAEHKMQIRRVFHRQLAKLWREHPTLSGLMYCKGCGVQNKHIAAHLGTGIDGHDLAHISDYIAEKFPRSGFNFCPISCEEFALSCSLEILFLRQGVPYGTLIGGDLDNRIKTVIDALSIPTALPSGFTPTKDENVFYCLLDDDNQVSSLSVTSDTLLEEFDSPDEHGRDAMLVIGVELRPYMPTHFNLAFA